MKESYNKNCFLSKSKHAFSYLSCFLFLFIIGFSLLFFAGCDNTKTTQKTEYSILLLDEDKITTLYAQNIKAGEPITNVPTPTKSSDLENDYEFNGWVNEKGEKIILSFANSDITAYASYSSTARQYTVTVKVNDNIVSSYDQVEIIKDDEYLTTGSIVHYGDTLQIDVKGSEGHTVFGSVEYQGLKKIVVGNQTVFSVTGDVTISLNETINKYNVKFLNYDETLIFQTQVEYGDAAMYEGIPTREEDMRASYKFDGWVDFDGFPVDLTRITSNMVVYAHYYETLKPYTLTINDPENVTVFNGLIELFDGSTIHYNDELRVVTNVTEGYHIKSITANGQDISNGSMKVVGNMTVAYEEEINIYKVLLYDEDRTSTLLSQDVTYGSTVVAETPTKNSDLTYNYVFIGWFDSNNVEVNLSLIKSNITAYAKYKASFIEYALNISGSVNVIMTSGEIYTSESNATLHYGDTFTVEYDLANGYSVNTFTVSGASENENVYVVEGEVNVVFKMEKTFEALKYKDLQAFTQFEGDDGSVVDVEECVDNNSKITYTYVGFEEIVYTAVYNNFLEVEQTLIYEGQVAAQPDFANNTITGKGLNFVSTLTTPLYKGMSIEFVTNFTEAKQFLFGISSQEWLDNAISHTCKMNNNYYFSVEYNLWSYKEGSKLSYLYANSSLTSNYILNENYNIFGTSTDYTIRLVLNDKLELYVNDVLVDLNTEINQRVPDFIIEENTPYYFSCYMGSSLNSITFTDFGYYENNVQAYLDYLKGKTITTFGDSITQGSGASNDEVAGTTASQNKYVSVLSSKLDMTLNNMGEGNTGYCTGRINELNGTDASRIDDVANIPVDSAIVIVYFGINDIRNSSDTWGGLGTIDSTDTTTIYGAINVMYSAIAERFAGSNATIFVCDPTPTSTDLNGEYVYGGGYSLKQLSSVIHERASYYGFEFISLLENCGFTTDSFVDSVHPTNEGHSIIANLIYNAIINYGKLNYIN